MKIKGLEYLKCNEEKVIIPEALSLLPESMRIFLQFYKTGVETDIYQFTNYSLQTDEIEKFRWTSSDKNKPWLGEGDRLLELFTINKLKLN